MNGHPIRAIGEIAKAKGGKRLPKGLEVQDEETDHPYLRVVDFGPDGVNRSSIKFISDEVFDYVSRYTITSDDVYVSIAGTIGRVGIVPDDLSGANLTENAAKITDISGEVDKRYLLAFLRSAAGQGALQNKAGGTSQPKLALFRIEEIEFPCPSLQIQRTIADILSAYDDLIENNQRRMALLEEAARQLYREWFIRLRFPGCEHTCFTDGVPEGWEKRPLGDVATLNYGKALKEANRIPGDVAVYGSSGVVGSHESKLVDGPSIVVGRKGNVGSIFWVDEASWPIDTVYYIGPEHSNLHLFHGLEWLPFQSSDAAVPGLNRNYAYSLPVLVPPETLPTQFDEFARQNYSQIRNLKLANQKLRAARDFLLPRLMSGELVV